jgi:YjbE family integral membrane protein
MSFLGLPDFLGKPLAVMLLDLLLAGDNALVIALVCLSLPPHSRRRAMLLGAAGAILLRVVLIVAAGGALAVPGLKLVGAALVGLLALNLARPGAGGHPAAPAPSDPENLLAAALLVVLIDVLMSVDNVLALAAVAGDSPLYLAFGLLLSVSILMFGGVLVSGMIGRQPGLALLGAALLGWVAGQMALSDPLLTAWVTVQAPALPLIVPPLAAAYVYLVGRDAPASSRRRVDHAVTVTPAGRDA